MSSSKRKTSSGTITVRTEDFIANAGKVIKKANGSRRVVVQDSSGAIRMIINPHQAAERSK